MAQCATVATVSMRALVSPAVVARPSTSVPSSQACIVSRRFSMPVRKHMQQVAAQGVRASTPADISKMASGRSVPKQVIEDAKKTCEENPAEECAAAWDEVEELSAEAAHRRDRAKANPSSVDPLEKFCEDNPETDECRVYED